MSRPILVGVDGSTAAEHAADYAAARAAREGVGLRLAQIFRFPPPGFAAVGIPYLEPVSEQSLRDELSARLGRLAERLHRDHPDLGPVHVEITRGVPAEVLVERSGDVAYTVLGSRGRGGFPGLRLGSVAEQVAVHAHGPVMVVPESSGERDEDRTVVVGHDGSSGAEAALRFAADEAAARAAPLLIIRAYRDTRPDDHADAARALGEVADRVHEEYPDLNIEVCATANRSAAAELVALSERAALTVAGSRGRGGFTGLLLGSVSLSLAHNARGPVAIVHGEAVGRPGTRAKEEAGVS